MIRRSILPKKRRSGAVAVVVALCLIPLIGVTAFAIDGGLLIAERRRAQTVADAAAYASACRLYNNLSKNSDPTGLDPLGTARAAGYSNASANGYTNDGTTNTVKINIPPSNLSKLFQTKAGYAEVVVVFNQPRIFSAVLGSGTLSITARAVARGIRGQPAAYTTASLLLLDPSASSALQVSGGARLNADSPIQVNSSNASAINVNGGSFMSAPSIQVTGGDTVQLGSSIQTTKSSAVQTAAPTMTDPLASLAAPNPAPLTPRSFSSTYGSATINPGVYAGGLSLGNGMNITMNPGVYYMQGGSFSVGGGVTLKGNGVTIYMDNGGGQLSLQGGANVTLTPPTSGTYAGLTYFQNRNSTKSLGMANGSTNNISGTIYAASATASFSGGTSSKSGSQFVVKDLSVSGGSTFTLTTAADAKQGYIASGASTPSVTMVE